MRNDNLIKHEILKHLAIKDDNEKFHQDKLLSIKELEKLIDCSKVKLIKNCKELYSKGCIFGKLDEKFKTSNKGYKYFISNKYLEESKKIFKENIKFWFNIIIPVLSLIIAFISINYKNNESEKKIDNYIKTHELKFHELKVKTEYKIQELQKKLKYFQQNSKNLESYNNHVQDEKKKP
ncbi:hypothetical protein Q4595_16040 [Wenyingzhuangia sp. 1_MG-2023]|nr:hypothetical protein [Wenyingzhuangia sp. 1_MG-2023]